MQITPVSPYRYDLINFESDQKKVKTLIKDLKSIKYPEIIDYDTRYDVMGVRSEINRLASFLEQKQDGGI